VPKVDVSDWSDSALHEQLERLADQGAEPRIMRTLSWLSTAERQQREQDRADETYCAAMRDGALKGANRSHATKLRSR
jgi:hypothetical protein